MTAAALTLDGSQTQSRATSGRSHRDTSGPAHLDSGRAWLMLALMYLINATVGGSSRAYGLVYAKQVALGYYDRQAASWPIATASTVENLAGILTPALAQFLSWRQIQLLSTSLFVLANLGAYFSDSLAADIACLGLIQGLALSMCTLLTLTINNHYFERYRTTAYGLAMCGGTCGILYLGPLISWILERDAGFRDAYLVLALFFTLNYPLSLFVVPAGTRPAPPASGARRPSVERKRSRFECHFERKQSVASISIECKLSRQSTLSRCTCGWRLTPKTGDTAATSTDHAAGLEAGLKLDSAAGCRCPARSIADASQAADLLQRLSGAPMGAKRVPPPPRLADRAPEVEPQQQTESEFCMSLALELLRSPYQHCVWLMLTLYFMVSRVFIIVSADFAADRGLSAADSAGLLNYWSAGELLGRIILCSFVDLQWLSVRNCITLTCGSLAAAIALMVQLRAYYAYAACLLLIAALASLECVLVNVLIIEYLGKQRATGCYAIGSLIAAPLLLLRPALIGLFRDQLGSYDGLLLLLAAFSGAFALLFALLEPLAARRWPKSAAHAQNQAARIEVR